MAADPFKKQEWLESAILAQEGSTQAWTSFKTELEKLKAGAEKK